jgi:Phage tail tube protein
MAATNRIGGVLAFFVDGQTYEARGNFQVTPSRVRRTGVAGQDAVHGYIEEPVVPQIRGNITVKNGATALSLQTLEGVTSSTVQINLANGMTYILSQAWVTSAFNIDGHDGQVECTFEGMSISEAQQNAPVGPLQY